MTFISNMPYQPYAKPNCDDGMPIDIPEGHWGDVRV